MKAEQIETFPNYKAFSEAMGQRPRAFNYLGAFMPVSHNAMWVGDRVIIHRRRDGSIALYTYYSPF